MENLTTGIINHIQLNKVKAVSKSCIK